MKNFNSTFENFKRNYFCIIFFLVSLLSFGQFDTEFWVPASPPYDTTALKFVLTTQNPSATVNFYSGTNLIFTTSVLNGVPIEVTMPNNPSTGVTYGMDKFDNNNLNVPNAGTINHPGLRITSNVPVSVVGHYDRGNNQELVQFKGRTALGNSFRVGSQTHINAPNGSPDYEDFGNGGGGSHFVSVMATQDNTSITFDNLGRTLTDPGQGSNFSTGTLSNYTFTLNKGQTRWLMTTSVNNSFIMLYVV